LFEGWFLAAFFKACFAMTDFEISDDAIFGKSFASGLGCAAD